MKYNREIAGLSLRKDAYAEQFAEAGDIKTNYQVYHYGDCLEESENPRELAKTLKAKADRLVKMANFLERFK